MKIYKVYQDYPNFSKKPPVAPYITTEILQFGLVMDAEILSRITPRISVDQYHKAISTFLDKILFSDPTDYQQILGLHSPSDSKLIEKHYGLLIGLLQKPEIRTADNEKNLSILDKAYSELVNLRESSSVPRTDQLAQKKPAVPNIAKARKNTDKGAAKTSAKTPETRAPAKKAVGGEDFQFSESTTQSDEEKKPIRTKGMDKAPQTTSTKLVIEAKRHNISRLDDSRKQQDNRNKQAPEPTPATTPIKPGRPATENHTVELKPPARPTTQAKPVKQPVDLPDEAQQLDDVIELDDIGSDLPNSRQPRYRYAQVVASLVVVALVGAAYELLYKSTPNTIVAETHTVIRNSDSLPVEKKSPPAQAVLRDPLQEIDAPEIQKDLQLEVLARETIKPEGKPTVKSVKSIAAKRVKPVIARPKATARKTVHPSPAKSMIARTETVTRPKSAPIVVNPVSMKKAEVQKRLASTAKATIKSPAVNQKQAPPSASEKTVAKATTRKVRHPNEVPAKAIKSSIEAFLAKDIESGDTTVARVAQKNSVEAKKSSPFVIIVNAKNNQDLSAEDLKNIYFDRITTWKSGGRIDLYDLPVSSKVREMFSNSVLSISARKAAQREKNERITNSTRNIPKQKSENLVTAIVANNLNAIGYVSIKSAKSRDGIRIIYPE